MADNTKESTRPIAKLPTRLIVNTDTGAADLYVDEGVFGRTLVATGSAIGNNWAINDNFVSKYNARNGTNLTKTQLQQTFTKDYQKTLNNDRAAIVNTYSPVNTKRYLQETAKVPGIINPETGTKTEDTTPTPSTANTPDASGDTSRPPDLTNLQAATAVDEEKTRIRFKTDLIYPLDLRQTKQDIIKFDMLQYKPRGFSTNQGLSGIGEERNSKRNSIGTVILPIPSGISDANLVNWGSENLNPAEAAAANLALTTITQGFNAGGKVIEGIANQVQENTGEVGTAIAAAAASAATGLGRQLLTRTTGAIINENMELLFQGPSLRPFSFSFKLSPRNKQEAEKIIQIIRFFKQGMSPQRSSSNLFLKSPHTFRIRYITRSLGDSNESPYIGKIKECALQNFGVSYTPEGQYATFYDGVLASYEITMQFTELEPVYNDDYTSLDGNADTQIGY
jgi:hypothetical protein